MREIAEELGISVGSVHGVLKAVAYAASPGAGNHGPAIALEYHCGAVVAQQLREPAPMEISASVRRVCKTRDCVMNHRVALNSCRQHAGSVAEFVDSSMDARNDARS